MNEKESSVILFQAFKNSGIFSGNYDGSWCLVIVQNVNSKVKFIPLLYIASLGVEWTEIYDHVKTSVGAWLLLAKFEENIGGVSSVLVRGKLACWNQIVKALGKQEVSNRADVDQRREAQQEVSNSANVDEQREALLRDLSMMLYNIFSGLELKDITTTNGMLGVYDRIYKGLLKMLYELPLDSLKNLEAILEELSHPSERLVVFWDYDNCSIPTRRANVPPKKACGNIKAYIKCKFKIDEKSVVIYAYGDFSRIAKVQKALEDTGVVVINTPKVNNQKDVADKAIIYALGRMHAIRNSPSMMLITGDVDFAYALKNLHDVGHKIILAIRSGVWVSYALTDASDYVLYWPNLVRGKDQPALHLQIRKDMMLVEEKQPSIVGIPVEPQLQLLSLKDVKPLDLKGLKPELLTLLKDSNESRTLLALLRIIGKC